MGKLVSKQTEPGTLVWIGDPGDPEFQDPFQYCVSQVAQVALRSTLGEAIRRPATGVRRIILTRATTRPLPEHSLRQVVDLYPQAPLLSLMGSLCEGACRGGQSALGAGPSEQGVQTLHWHAWNQVLPGWVGAAREPDSFPLSAAQSVAVISANWSTGEPLLDLAESAGATVIWCRTAETLRIRNVDVVWWDDSVASATSSCRWRDRVAAFRCDQRTTRHAWIANAPRHHQQRQAAEGGIELVVSKPHRIDCLIQMLTNHQAVTVTEPVWKAA